jgi:hypothetical protein
VERLAGLLNNSHQKRRTLATDSRHGFGASEMLTRIVTNLPEPRSVFWPAFRQCVSINPQSARWLVSLFALYLHLGPFSRYVVSEIEKKMKETGRGPRAKQNPALV